MRMRRPVGLWVVLLVVVIVSGGCASVPAPTGLPPSATPLPPTPPPTSTPIPAASPTRADSPAPTPTDRPTRTHTATATPDPTPSPTNTPLHPLSIEHMRRQTYPGSELVIEETLAPGVNYRRAIVSYRSEGFKIFALLTIPNGPRPATGWPVVIFNHGHISPEQYRPTERYVAYVDAFARNGYIVFRSDYRGHGNSEGNASGSYGSADYTVDVLNGIASIVRHPDADPQRVGMWGHSMGGGITLRAMVVSQEIKAGVIWAGTVASYPDLLRQRTRTPSATAPSPGAGRRWLGDFVSQYGSVEQNPTFWYAISPNTFLRDLSGPVQLHHGTADASVPLEYSETLYQQIQEAGKSVELYTYAGDNHNISINLGLAMQRSLAFMDRYVKGATR